MLKRDLRKGESRLEKKLYGLIPVTDCFTEGTYALGKIDLYNIWALSGFEFRARSETIIYAKRFIEVLSLGEDEVVSLEGLFNV